MIAVGGGAGSRVAVASITGSRAGVLVTSAGSHAERKTRNRITVIRVANFFMGFQSLYL
jgi:hypothetical protein